MPLGKKRDYDTYNTMDGHASSKKPDTRRYLLYDSIYIKSRKCELLFNNRKWTSGHLGDEV